MLGSPVFGPLATELLTALGHHPTPGQERAALAIERLMGTVRPNPVLVLKGYAGTGKTTLVGALVNVLARRHTPVVLLAPTGRAAKVLGGYARATAGTIHRRIYRSADHEADGFAGAHVTAHRDAGALFVVDEASMIGGVGDEAIGSSLLEDLFQHAFSAPGCRVLLIGDPAQLPPVGSLHSAALDVRHLCALGLTAGQVEMTDVVRQEQASGILVNATALRALVPPQGQEENAPAPQIRFTPFPDVVRMDGYELQDALEDAYARDGGDEVCIVCRSNKRAYQYSMQVRARVYGYEEELSAGDRLMVVRNNYLWAGLNGRAELIANGEPITVKRVHGIEERFGLRFADITASWWNGMEERELDVKVMVDVLAMESPALPGARMRELARMVVEHARPATHAARTRLIREDPWLNALQVKYGYAVTCHKAQGGQWNTVFVDQGYITEDMIDIAYVRWLYTAVTRASQRLYLLNFHPRFWGEE